MLLQDQEKVIQVDERALVRAALSKHKKQRKSVDNYLDATQTKCLVAESSSEATDSLNCTVLLEIDDYVQ